jgi:uncharacterized heparinase superfamily protein
VKQALPNWEIWQFSAIAIEAELKDSVFLTTADGLRCTEQIVLMVRPSETPSVR